MSDRENEAAKKEFLTIMERVMEDISIIDNQVDKISKLNRVSKLDIDFDPASSIAELLKAKAMLLREIIYIKMN